MNGTRVLCMPYLALIGLGLAYVIMVGVLHR
ncbi:MAG: hypothetical protein JWP64_1459 [Pseudonocardia sp.]|nr:hypothetical protein [Pseudonocardia sp.]MDT7700436.1 hypothetical protein [Pseudonocardiales bacterium]